MSKKRTRTAPSRGDGKSRTAQRQSPKAKMGSGAQSEQRPAAATSSATREIIESIVIAFVLAFLFRTFEAEAFVIPTGSMAPTLMGRHKDLICENCGFPFRASASDEINSRTNAPSGEQVVAATCPNCRHTMYVGPDPRSPSHPSYKGDRILVTKFPYRLGDPERWDVAVFKYPGEARTNFIKRIVGLPGETIAIRHGDLFIKNGDHNGWKIARKPLEKIRAMMRLVYDDDYVQPQIASGIWPARWTSPGPAGGWEVSEDLKSFRASGGGQGEVWLGYQHRVPSWDDWQALKDGSTAPRSLRPELISDFAAYNTDSVRTPIGHDDMNDVPPPSPDKLGLHWVGDLAVECQLTVASESGEAVFELVEGGRRFQCRFDVATGLATLGIDGKDDFHPTAQTSVHGPGTHRIFFANFDDQLVLSVDGGQVKFDAPTTFGPLGNDRPTPADLEPARIGSAGASLEIAHLKLYRDIYYISERLRYGDHSAGPISDYDYFQFPYRPFTREEVARVQSDPQDWAALSSTRPGVEFPLGEDRFLVFGDNSAESKDSRLWEAEGFEYYVSRELLIGKALVIYWPHSLDRIPGTSIPIRFFPNFQRMRFVR